MLVVRPCVVSVAGAAGNRPARLPVAYVRPDPAAADTPSRRAVRRARARTRFHCRPPSHPTEAGAGPFLTGVAYCPFAPSSRLAMAGRSMSTTPRNGNVFLLGPSGNRPLRPQQNKKCAGVAKVDYGAVGASPYVCNGPQRGTIRRSRCSSWRRWGRRQTKLIDEERMRYSRGRQRLLCQPGHAGPVLDHLAVLPTSPSNERDRLDRAPSLRRDGVRPVWP